MSQTATNISVSSDDVYAPWQYKWKRPRIAEAKPFQPYSYENQLRDKIPINTASARLTKDEISTLLQHEHQDKEQYTGSARMKWEDLESESDEEEGRFNDDLSDEFILMVTIFAAKSLVKLLQSKRRPDEQVLVPADTILLEVIRDSHRIDDSEVLEENIGRESIDVVMSKILFWPTSALVETHSGEEEVCQDRAKDTQVKSGQAEIGSERADIKEMENELLPGSNRQKNIWKSIKDTLKLPKSVDDMSDEERRQHYERQMDLKLKMAKRRIGVTNVALCRQLQHGPDLHLQMDEIMDVLDRMTLGIGLDLDQDLLATRIETENESDNQDDGSEELLLSCLCNDGKVQIFSILDLLYREKELPKSKVSPEDAFISSFESLILGNALKLSLQSTILPLSNPKSTIDLSVMSIKGKVVEKTDNQGGERRDQSEMDPQLVRLRKLGHEINEYRPHLDLSLLDANIEPGTMHNQCMNNIPFLCACAHGFIAIAGTGIRKRRRVRAIPSDINTTGTRSVWNDYTLPGGFLSLISTRHLVETRTIFLPFPPKMIHPLTWNKIDFIIVLGHDEGQCVAIRTDASSFVSTSLKTTPELGNSFAGSSSNQKHDFVKKFIPIPVYFYGCEESVGTFPVSVSVMPASCPSIVTCTIDEGDVVLLNFDLDSFQFLPSKNKREWGVPEFCISAKSRSRQFLEISPASHIEMSVRDLLNPAPSETVHKRNLRCVNGQGWMLICLQIDDRMHLQYVTLDGATEMEGAYHQEVAVLDHRDHLLTDNVLNFDFLDTIKLARNISSRNVDNEKCSPEEQVAVCSLRLETCATLALSMRRSVMSNRLTSSYSDIILWLCSQKRDYCTAAAISLSLLHDHEALADLDLAIAPTRNDPYVSTNYDGLLESITPLGLHEWNASSRRRTSESMSTAISQHDLQKQRIVIDLSNTAVSCLVNGGSKLSGALDKFLGRNDYYDEISACRTLVLKATSTIMNLRAGDMKQLAPYSFNPMESQHHALWPIQCLLRVAVTRDCMDSALEMLNKSIPDELRHRSDQIGNEDENSYRSSSLRLSRSIISMILASADHAGSALMGLRESSSNKLYWESLDDETRLCLSMLHVHGRYPLLREPEVRRWALQILQAATGLLISDTSRSTDSEVVVPSEWLREMCTGVLSNAGCDLSQTILFTPALSIEGVQSVGTDDDNMFKHLQEEEEDLYDYLTAAPGCGGIDFDIIIPAFLTLEDRRVHWLGNEKVQSQTILNIVCDLAGRHSSEEPRFSFDSVAVMKQCVKMNNAQAAANLIGGHSGLILKCAHILSFESHFTMKEAEQLLLGRNIAPTSRNSPNHEYSDKVHFTLTKGHKALLWLLEKHTIRVKRYGGFYAEESRGQIDPVFAARTCLQSWLYLMPTYPASGRWLEKWLQERLNLDNARDNTSNRLPSAAVIRALLWPADENTVLAISLGFSLPFLVNLSQVPCGLLECIPPTEIPKEVLTP